MKKLAILATVALVAFATPHGAFAKKSATSTSAASATPVASAEKSERAIPYRGTISAVDKSAKTFTIASKNGSTRVFTVTSETKLMKRSGGEATWSDIVEGAYVTGSGYKKEQTTVDGKKVTHYDAKSVKVGEKTTAPKKS